MGGREFPRFNALYKCHPPDYGWMVGKQVPQSGPRPDRTAAAHRTPSAWMTFSHPLVIAEGGGIPLHWMAA
jgi:hypothetical protein